MHWTRWAADGLLTLDHLLVDLFASGIPQWTPVAEFNVHTDPASLQALLRPAPFPPVILDPVSLAHFPDDLIVSPCRTHTESIPYPSSSVSTAERDPLCHLPRSDPPTAARSQGCSPCGRADGAVATEVRGERGPMDAQHAHDLLRTSFLSLSIGSFTDRHPQTDLHFRPSF